MRLINADALRDRFQNLAYDDWNQGVNTTWANAYKESADIVDSAPTVDVVERKKGKWIQNTTYPMIGSDAVVAEAYCSECELYSSQINAFGYVTYDICPRCGAEMVKGEDDAEVH